MWVAGVMAQSGGDVGGSSDAEGSDGEAAPVAMALGALRSAGVLGSRGAEPRLSVNTDQFREPGWGGLPGVQAGD